MGPPWRRPREVQWSPSGKGCCYRERRNHLHPAGRRRWPPQHERLAPNTRCSRPLALSLGNTHGAYDHTSNDHARSILLGNATVDNRSWLATRGIRIVDSELLPEGLLWISDSAALIICKANLIAPPGRERSPRISAARALTPRGASRKPPTNERWVVADVDAASSPSAESRREEQRTFQRRTVRRARNGASG